MQVNSILLKSLRADKHWSQEQLGDACGLSLRTIQRLETTGKASLESIKALATIFEIEPDELILKEIEENHSPIESIKTCFIKFANFSDTATKSEFWWFFLFVLLVTAITTVLNDKIFQIVSLLILTPFIAVGTRRLRDSGHSGWWQLLYVVPFGIVVVFFLFAQETKPSQSSSQS